MPGSTARSPRAVEVVVAVAIELIEREAVLPRDDLHRVVQILLRGTKPLQYGNSVDGLLHPQGLFGIGFGILPQRLRRGPGELAVILQPQAALGQLSLHRLDLLLDGSIRMRSGAYSATTFSSALPKSPTSEQQMQPEFISVMAMPASCKKPPSMPISPNSFSISTSFSPE